MFVLPPWLSSLEAPCWEEAAPLPSFAMPLSQPQALPRHRCCGCAGPSLNRSWRKAKAQHQCLYPTWQFQRNPSWQLPSCTTVWRTSTQTVVKLASTVCQRTATDWGSTWPARRTRACTLVTQRLGPRTHTVLGTTQASKPNQMLWRFICTLEVSAPDFCHDN